MRKRISQIIILVMAVLLVGIVWSLYVSYRESGFTTSFASTLSTLALVILTAWYAHSTRELLETNESQVEAARASYMPALDVDYDYDGEYLSFDIRNRGQGVARNVSILVSIVGRGIDTYQLKLSESLPPQYSYATEGGTSQIEFEPRFYTEYTEHSLAEMIELGEGPDEIFPDGDIGRSHAISESDIDNLQEFMNNIGTEKALYSKMPSAVGDFEDIIGKHTKDRPDTYSPAIYLQVVFTDVMYGQTHQETILDGVYTNPTEPSFTELLPGEHSVTSGFLSRTKNFREVHGEVVKAPIPYIEEMDVDIRSNE